MWRNYLKVAVRTIRRRPLYAAINVFGLAVGMAACILIGLYVAGELSYDEFHARADRIYQVGQESQWGRMQATPYPLATALESGIPDIEEVVRTWGGGGGNAVTPEGSQQGYSLGVMLADEGFFDVFSFDLVRGDPDVLADPGSAAITSETARRLFGEEDPIGREIRFRAFDAERRLTVGAVVEAPPPNSTVEFDVVGPMSLIPAQYTTENGWGSFMYRTYVLTREPAAAGALDETITAVLESKVDLSGRSFFSLPLTSVYFSDVYSAEGFRGQARYVYIFGSIALFILLLALINYVNMVTARSEERAREVGLRRGFGATRGQLATQFLGESVVLSVVALGVGLLLAFASLPAFNGMFGTDLTLGLGRHGLALLGLCGAMLLAGVASGIYPAFVLSRFAPSNVLSGADTRSSSGGGLLRKGLIVLQFAISIALIVGTAIVHRQLDFMQERHLTLEGAHVAILHLTNQQADRLSDQIKQRIQQQPAVEAATVTTAQPGNFNITLVQDPSEFSSEAETDRESLTVRPGRVDADYLRTVGLNLLAGRNFSPDRSSDESRAYILNETAVEQMGWTVDGAIGRPFEVGAGAPDGEVIGVVEDFPIESMHQPIEPVALMMTAHGWGSNAMVMARTGAEGVTGIVGELEAALGEFAPGAPFRYSFLDEEFDELYRAEIRLRQVAGVFAGVAIFLACLGLFGLAAYSASRRTKEIGIRKVLGATITDVVGLLSREFLRLVGIALLIGAPLAYLGMTRWLQDYAYRIEIGPGVFLVAAALAVTLTVLTVGYHAVKTALLDPARTLRYE